MTRPGQRQMNLSNFIRSVPKKEYERIKREADRAILAAMSDTPRPAKEIAALARQTFHAFILEGTYVSGVYHRGLIQQVGVYPHIMYRLHAPAAPPPPRLLSDEAYDFGREAFDAGWEALHHFHHGPSAAGYPATSDEAWALFVYPRT